MTAKTRAGILISGRGSNMASLLAAAASPNYPVDIAVVIANRPNAGGLKIAQDAGVPAVCVDHKPFRGDRAAHERAVDAVLRAHSCDYVCLAGYMRLLTPWLVGAWAGRALNIHPSLLPAFPGLHTHERAIAAGAKIHGCTVHLVTDAMDEGPILAQAAVPVLPNDTADTLAARVLAQEHFLYPLALRLVVTGDVGKHDPSSRLINPLDG